MSERSTSELRPAPANENKKVDYYYFMEKYDVTLRPIPKMSL